MPPVDELSSGPHQGPQRLAPEGSSTEKRPAESTVAAQGESSGQGARAPSTWNPDGRFWTQPRQRAGVGVGHHQRQWVSHRPAGVDAGKTSDIVVGVAARLPAPSRQMQHRGRPGLAAETSSSTTGGPARRQQVTLGARRARSGLACSGALVPPHRRTPGFSCGARRYEHHHPFPAPPPTLPAASCNPSLSPCHHHFWKRRGGFRPSPPGV